MISTYISLLLYLTCISTLTLHCYWNRGLLTYTPWMNTYIHVVSLSQLTEYWRSPIHAVKDSAYVLYTSNSSFSCCLRTPTLIHLTGGSCSSTALVPPLLGLLWVITSHSLLIYSTFLALPYTVNSTSVVYSITHLWDRTTSLPSTHAPTNHMYVYTVYIYLATKK